MLKGELSKSARRSPSNLTSKRAKFVIANLSDIYSLVNSENLFNGEEIVMRLQPSCAHLLDHLKDSKGIKIQFAPTNSYKLMTNIMCVEFTP